MKRRLVIILILSGFLHGYSQQAREGGSELKLSLRDAQDYAILNNKSVLAARADVMASKAAVWETISAALPQLNANGTFADNLKLMTTLLPGEFFGQPGTKIPVTFGSKYNSSASFQANLLIFNAPLFLGIETSKLAYKLNANNLELSELDTKEAVSSAYFLILVSEKSLEILNANIANLNETLRSTRSMYSAGMAESTDVDQMVSNVTMMDNNRSSLLRTIELNYNLLRFQLGVSADTRIILTDNLEGLTNAVNVEALMSQDFDHTKNINYKLVEGQELMSELALKSQKASVLPTLAGFYNYGTSGMGDKMRDLSWFPNSMAGLQVSVPIFASGERYAKIQKAKYNLNKARITRNMIEDQLLIQEKQLRYNLVNANLQYQSQKENVDVLERVYKSTENKYMQGMASSLELTQANTQYLQAENNYVSALMNLLLTKLALDKLLNNL
ncbi:MAG TPA: TolC family protein [Bacteroidales bacterium]|nr:TolC family protein [Bacteroidales bacterium]HNR42034.1 TolC family protein [Bacteroidales bacterium]HPM17777.1 TolC family protein [Bacteroidales bacterium]HQG77719.1 TolC family protein [Bacteroidales bacterium]